MIQDIQPPSPCPATIFKIYLPSNPSLWFRFWMEKLASTTFGKTSTQLCFPAPLCSHFTDPRCSRNHFYTKNKERDKKAFHSLEEKNQFRTDLMLGWKTVISCYHIGSKITFLTYTCVYIGVGWGAWGWRVFEQWSCVKTECWLASSCFSSHRPQNYHGTTRWKGLFLYMTISFDDTLDGLFVPF